MEALEAREVPAVIVWTNGTGDNQFDNEDNWEFVGGGEVVAPPGANDDVYFDGYISIASCNNFRGPLSPGGGEGLMGGESFNPLDEFHSVHLINNYLGTVTLSFGFQTAILEQTSGAFSQPVSGTDITVSGNDVMLIPGSNPQEFVSFYWTGGTLNSSTNTSTVMIQGDGKIAPANAGTVYIGSTLQLQPVATPKTVTVMPGTIQFDNAAGAVIGAFGILRAKATVAGQVIGFQEQNATTWDIAHSQSKRNGVVVPEGFAWGFVAESFPGSVVE